MKTKKLTNYNRFLILWVGELISAVGGGLTSFGLGVYAVESTESAAGKSLVMLLAYLPSLILSAPAGVLADRYDRRLLMMLGDGLSGLGIVYILICKLTGELALYQICIGVLVSSVFSSLMEPAFKATVTDLLTKEEYSKASAMISLTSGAKYIVSPILAGILLTFSGIELLLIIDICTFFVTVGATFTVKKGLGQRTSERKEGFKKSFAEGWKAVTGRKGVLILVVMYSVVTCFLGTIEVLADPLVLDFADQTVLGIGKTICASGMLVSAVYLSLRGIKKHYVRVLGISMFIAGVGMVLFGIKENIYLISASGFVFFSMLPIANSCLDYLVRSNIPAGQQGRAWGLIGFLSEIGYIVAYAFSGPFADGIGALTGRGMGRGSGTVIVVSGALLALCALLLFRFKDVRKMEDPEETALTETEEREE